MKKLKIFIPILLSIVIGYLFGTFIYKQYDEAILAFSDSKVIYFLQQGVFSNNNSLNEDISNLDVHLVEHENDNYYVYVGLTSSYELAEKIKGIYKEKGYNLYIKEKNITNKVFINEIGEYDKLISTSNDFDNLNKVLSVVIDSYENSKGEK